MTHSPSELRLRMFKSKLHRATLTEANVDYEGSLTIAEDLLEAAKIRNHEEVHVWNATRGTRLSTYAIRGEAGSGVICLNGAAAHLGEVGDRIIIATFAEMPESMAATWEPTVVLLDENNCIVDRAAREIPGPDRRVAE